MSSLSDQGLPTLYEVADYAGTYPLYVGEVAVDGSWRITSFSSSTKTLRYCIGLQDYGTNWTGRAALTYALPNEV
jgi:hypothetical protein